MAKLPRFTRCLECHKKSVDVVYMYRAANGQIVLAPFCGEQCLTIFIERKKDESHSCTPAKPY